MNEKNKVLYRSVRTWTLLTLLTVLAAVACTGSGPSVPDPTTRPEPTPTAATGQTVKDASESRAATVLVPPKTSTVVPTATPAGCPYCRPRSDSDQRPADTHRHAGGHSHADPNSRANSYTPSHDCASTN